jgi:hypothetical protein
MYVEVISHPSISSRNHERLAIRHEPHVADKALIKNPVSRGAIVNRAVSLAHQTGTHSGSVIFGHAEWNSGKRQE